MAIFRKRDNWLLGTATQPIAAASRHGLHAGQRQRYPVIRSPAEGVTCIIPAESVEFGGEHESHTCVV